ncbi:MAG: protein kinase domain-containing protein [Limisphaerales bacterium]
MPNTVKKKWCILALALAGVLGVVVAVADWLQREPADGGERFAACLGVFGAMILLGVAGAAASTGGKFSDVTVALANFGNVRLTQVLTENSETQMYRTDHPGVVVKMFDLSCAKADEVSYGPYMGFALEVANFEDVLSIGELRPFVPAYYGANIDYGRKHAFIAMEYLEGQGLRGWCEEAFQKEFHGEWVDEFREAACEALSIIHRFHRHGIILIDFKPDNVIRLKDKRIKFVDLGAVLTPRQRGDSQKYVYSATPDHAEVLIDASNLQAGVWPTEASDIFSVGVALFEMATGGSRLAIEGHTADEVLNNPAAFLFRDSQIRDVWRSYPHLKGVLPLLGSQLKERRLLFADLWPLLKGHVASRLSDWGSVSEQQQDQIILATGTTFIMEQLPPRLSWLAGPIAHATILRSIRAKGTSDLLALMQHPADEQVRADIQRHNCLVRYLSDLDRPIGFVDDLNTWEVRLDFKTGHWAITGLVACAQLSDSAQFTFLKQTGSDERGHRFFHIVCDFEADDFQDRKLTLWDFQSDHFAWLGSERIPIRLPGDDPACRIRRIARREVC